MSLYGAWGVIGRADEATPAGVGERLFVGVGTVPTRAVNRSRRSAGCCWAGEAAVGGWRDLLGAVAGRLGRKWLRGEGSAGLGVPGRGRNTSRSLSFGSFPGEPGCVLGADVGNHCSRS